MQSWIFYDLNKLARLHVHCCKKHAICLPWRSNISVNRSSPNCNKPVSLLWPLFDIISRHCLASIISRVRPKNIAKVSDWSLLFPIASSLKRSSNGLLRRQVHLMKNRIYKQTLIIKSQKYQMRHYRQLLRVRSIALKEHHRRLKSLEKKSKESEQSLVQIRNDNVTLLQRFDQFALLSDHPCTQPVEDSIEREWSNPGNFSNQNSMCI